MSREPLKNGTVLRFPDGQGCEIIRLLGAGGSALLYEGKILGSELYIAVKEIFPARGYVRKDGLICAPARLPRREKTLKNRKDSLLEREMNLSQKASRRNYQVLFHQPPVWNQADMYLPDGREYHGVENTYVRMDSLAEKGMSLMQFAMELRGHSENRLERVASVMETVLNAYAALHEDGFIHGDCQMSNLFLLKAGRNNEDEGTACIIDFGSARELGDDGLTEPINDEILSTDGYCAPELMFPRGENLRLSAAADVWSLGFLLRNLLSDQGLGAVEEITRYLMVHPEEKPLSGTELAELGCSPAQGYLLNHILQRALSNDPEERYSDAGAMRKEWQKLMRCRSMDLSKGVDRYLLWEASWRYCRANPSLLRTEHVPQLAKDLPIRVLFLCAKTSEEETTGSVHILLDRASERGENIYLHGAGGAGKSVAAALQIRHYLEHGEERVPLYLDLSAYTEERLEQCGGDADRVIPSLLAEQYFGTSELEPQIADLLKGESCCLVLDNLHKVNASVQENVIAVLNRFSRNCPNAWVLVMGRAENPGVRAEQTKVRQNKLLPPPPKPPADLRSKGRFRSRMDRKWDALFDECDALFAAYEEDAALPDEPFRSLNMTHMAILPFSADEIIYYVKQVKDDVLDFEARTALLKQEQTLCLPMFLMRYLELLWLDRGKGTALPNNSVELLHSYFHRQEYRANDRDVHDLLNEQLPRIAYQYGLWEEPAYKPNEITSWLKERGQWDLDSDAFFRHAVDNLAVLESDSRGRYRFVHDCYQEYFAALFAANCIRQAISRGSVEPLKDISHEWSGDLTSRCLKLCCLTVQNGQIVRARSETEVLDALEQILRHQKRRELIPVSDLLNNLLLWLNLVSVNGQIETNPDLLLRWRKACVRSLSGILGVITMLVTLLTTLLMWRKPVLTHLHALSLATEDGKAEYQLACCYKHGDHTKANLKKADEYLIRSEIKGYPPALNARGEQEEEKGNLQYALELYQQAAEMQYPRAFWHLGQMELKAKKPFSAFQRFEQGAQLGDSFSQYNLAQMLESGFGGREGREKILFWYEKAAEQGLAEAQRAAEKYREDHKHEHN